MYYLNLLPIPQTETDPLAYARRFFSEDVDEPGDHPRIDQNALADQLQKLLPDITREEDPKSREIDLYHTDRGEYEFEIYEDWIFLHMDMPIDNPEKAWNEVWQAIEALQFHGGLSVYDEQLDRLIQSKAELPEIIANYQKMSQENAARVVAPKSRFAPVAIALIIFAMFVTGLLIFMIGNQLPRFVIPAIWVFFGFVLLIRFLQHKKSQ